MLDELGAQLTDNDVIARVEAIGSIVVHRAPIERDDVATWRRRLRHLGRDRGIRVSVRKADDLAYVVSNPDQVVTREQLRAAVEAIPIPPELAPPVASAQQGPRRHFKIVDDRRLE